MIRKLRLLISCLLTVLLGFRFATAIPISAQSENTIVDLGWNADGTRFAAISDDGIVQVYDAATQQVTLTLPNNGFLAALDWHPSDPNRLAISTFEHGICILDVDLETATQPFEAKGYVYSVTFSPDGSRLAASTVSRNTGPSQEGWVEVFEIATGNRLISSAEVLGRIPVSQWSPDGQFIAGLNQGDFYNAVIIWDASTGVIVHRIAETPEENTRLPDTNYVMSGIDYFAWNPILPQIAIASTLDIGLFNTSDDTNSHVISDYTGDIQAIDWEPQGRLIAAASYFNRKIIIVDMTTGQVVNTIPTDFEVEAIAWSPDGSKLVYGGSVLLGPKPLPVIVSALQPPSINHSLIFSFLLSLPPALNPNRAAR